MNNLRIVSLEEADFITHSGLFHADDVFGTVLLCKVFDKVNLCRANNIVASKFSTNVIIYDIGNSEFDHHQTPKSRPNGNPYSSFGLLWKRFGREFIKKKGILDEKKIDTIFSIFDRFVAGIDANDCYGSASQKIFEKSYNIYNLSDVISSFNKRWEDEESVQDIFFIRAVSFAETIFDNIFQNVLSNIKAKDILETAIERAESGVLILERFMPWQANLFFSNSQNAKNIFFVVFPSMRGGWNCQAVPIEFRSNIPKIPFPAEWAGKNKTELAEITGVKTATFCHLGRFICGAETLEDTIQLAILALKDKLDK